MLKKKIFKNVAVLLAINIWLMSLPFVASAASNSSSKADALGEAETFVIKRGIMTGDGNGNYFFSNNIKRGDLIVMLVRAFNFNTSGRDNFSDVPLGSYYYKAIATAKSMGFAKGDGKYFKPNQNVTLEEAILFIERAASMADSEMKLNKNINLRKIFNNSMLSKPATRQDIANLIYYTFTVDGNIIGEENPKIIYYTVVKNKKIKFDENDFIEAYKNVTGYDLDCVKFYPPNQKYGTLYYNYSSANKYESLVDSKTEYYPAGISRVTFVPSTDYIGTVTLGYRAFNNDGDSMSGTVNISVEDNGKDKIKDIEYTTNPGKKIDFEADSFEKVFSKKSDLELEYVKFKLPSETYGKLYYLYNSVSDYESIVKENESYYMDKSPSVSDVTFASRLDFIGTLSISYIAYDEDGKSYDGVINIAVEKNEHLGESIPSISYTTFKNNKVEFNDTDFKNMFADMVDNKLYSVIFKLPPVSSGKLYYGYASEKKYVSLIEASKKYYVWSTPYLNEVDFVPKTGFTGKIKVEYTAYSEDGDSYPGTVEITVFNTNQTITYSTSKNKAVTFNAAHFKDVFKKATNGDLSYVAFALPSSSYGKLYYNRISSNTYASVVKSSLHYTPDESNTYLSEVAFVPKMNYTGKVLIKYVAFNEDGGYTTGDIQIIVK